MIEDDAEPESTVERESTTESEPESAAEVSGDRPRRRRSGPAAAGGLDLGRFNELLLDSAGVGMSIAHPDSLIVTFCNRRFGEWFPQAPEGEHRLDALLPGIDPGRLRDRVAAGRTYRMESEIKVRHRTVLLAIQITQTVQEGVPLLVVECQNVSRLKELEYMVESYSKMVEKQTRDLEKEKERVERVLLNIMPKSVYDEWKVFGVTTPQRYDEAAVLMLDFVDFTEMAVSKDPTALISELNDIFTAFDRIAEQFGCERIKTIGDAYMAVSGLPEANPDYARNITRAALRFAHYLRRRNRSHTEQWRYRIGIASGPVIGSIVGVQKYVYDIFGPGVNLAARMEAVAKPMQIAMSAELYGMVRSHVRARDVGEREIKGFGRQRVYLLEGSDSIRLAVDDAEDDADDDEPSSPW
jgi:class 3 adenylate cyclase